MRENLLHLHRTRAVVHRGVEHPERGKTSNSKVVLLIGENIPGSAGQAYQKCAYLPPPGRERPHSCAAGAQTDPAGPKTGTYRVARGGGWGGDLSYGRSAQRNGSLPADTGNAMGFRLARSY